MQRTQYNDGRPFKTYLNNSVVYSQISIWASQVGVDLCKRINGQNSKPMASANGQVVKASDAGMSLTMREMLSIVVSISFGIRNIHVQKFGQQLHSRFGSNIN